MARDPVAAVLENEMMLGDILHRMPSSKSYIRCSSVSKIWLATAKSRAVTDLFVKRNCQSFLGFIVESQGDAGRGIEMVFPAGAPAGETLLAVRASLDQAALSALPLAASDGARVLQVVDKPGQLAVGYHVSCPFSRPDSRRYAGFLIPKIPEQNHKDSKNTLGQYGVLMQTSKEEFSPMGFFVKDISTPYFASLYEGVRFASKDPVYMHVCVFQQSQWRRFVSQPIPSPPYATFHRNPYCVLVGKLLFMMYLVDFIVSFHLETRSFEVVNLPVVVSAKSTSWFDYTVAKGTGGGLALVHYYKGVVTRWVLDAQINVSIWRVECSFNIDGAVWGVRHNPFYGHVGGLSGTVQIRCASQDGRFILISVGLNAGLFVVDMLQKTVVQVPRGVANGKLGRVFQLGENWPPVI